MSKQVKWSPETKKHDGNPKWRIRYDKITEFLKDNYPKSVQRDSNDNTEDALWLEYCSAEPQERGRCCRLDDEQT